MSPRSAPLPHGAHLPEQDDADQQSSWVGQQSIPQAGGAPDFSAELREQLLAEVQPGPHAHAHHVHHVHGPGHHLAHSHGVTDVGAMQNANVVDPNIDPAITGSGMPVGVVGTGEVEQAAEGTGPASSSNGNGRALSSSKRAAQNRAAQRAFRQRKEAYIKKLEDELKAMKAIKDENAALQRENVCLRDYIIHLQERALETGTQVPPMPTSIAMGQPPTTSPTMASDEIPSLVPPTAGMVPEQAHAAVADMGGSRAAAPLQQARSQAHGFASPATSAHLAHGHQTGMVGYGASQRLQSAGQGSPVDPRDIDPNLTRATADHNHHPGRNASRSMLDPPPVTLAERAEIMRWRGGMGSGPGTGTGNGEGSGTGSGTGPGTGAGTNGNGPTL